MDFITAIKTCFQKYVVVSGRASRSEYWFWVLFSLLTGVVCSAIDHALFHAGFDATTQTYTNGPISGLRSLAFLLPSICVGVRRLHDINKSGWWMLINLLPIVGWIVYIVWMATKGTVGHNRFGADSLVQPTVG